MHFFLSLKCLEIEYCELRTSKIKRLLIGVFTIFILLSNDNKIDRLRKVIFSCVPQCGKEFFHRFGTENILYRYIKSPTVLRLTLSLRQLGDHLHFISCCFLTNCSEISFIDYLLE